MIEYMSKCPSCGKDAKIREGQVIRPNAVAWFRSTSCVFCGCRIEEDGDEAPHESRKLLEQSDGSWELAVGVQELRASDLKILKDALGLTIAELMCVPRTSGSRLIHGTKTEMEYFKNRCSELGLFLAVVEVQREA